MCGDDDDDGAAGERVDNSRGLDHLVTYCSAVTVKFTTREKTVVVYTVLLCGRSRRVLAKLNPEPRAASLC